MKKEWRVFWGSIAVLVIAFGLAQLLVPDVVPVGYSEEAQASWAVLTAFALRSIEFTAAWVAAISLTLLGGKWMLGMIRKSVKRFSEKIMPKYARLRRRPLSDVAG